MLNILFLCAFASVAKSYTIISVPLNAQPLQAPPGHQLKLVHVALGSLPNVLSDPHKWSFPNITIRIRPHVETLTPGQLNDMKLSHNNGQILQKRYEPFLKNFEQPWHPHLIDLRHPNNFNLTKNNIHSALLGVTGTPFCTDAHKSFPAQEESPVKHSLLNDIARVHDPDACPAFYKKFHSLINSKNIMAPFRDHLQNTLSRFPQLKDDPEKLDYLHNMNRDADQTSCAKDESEILKIMTRKVYETAFTTTSLKRLSAGRYVSNLLDDIDHLRNKGETPDGKKMVLFGSTSPFLKSIMSAMGGDDGYHSENLLPYPEAGSMLITEVFQKVEEQTYHIRLHYSHKPSEPISDKNILKLRGCDEMCEFNKFKKLMKPMYLTKDDADKECFE